MDEFVSVYLGRGPAAESAHQEALRREDERRDFQRRKREWEQQDAWIENYCQQVEFTIAARLIAAGFHQHRGELRRLRNQGAPSPTPAAGAPIASSKSAESPTIDEALGSLKSAVGRLDPLLNRVEIKNPKYVELLAKMKGSKPNSDTASAPRNQKIVRPRAPSPTNVRRAQLDATISRLDRSFGPGLPSRGRYSRLISRLQRQQVNPQTQNSKPPPRGP